MSLLFLTFLIAALAVILNKLWKFVTQDVYKPKARQSDYEFEEPCSTVRGEPGSQPSDLLYGSRATIEKDTFDTFLDEDNDD